MALGTVNGGDGSLFGRRTRRERGKWPGEKGDQHGPRPRLLARGWEEGGVDTAKQEVAGARLRASATRRASDWREEEDLPAPGGLGQPDGLPGNSLTLCLFLILSIFLFLFLCFELVKILTHFVNS